MKSTSTYAAVISKIDLGIYFLPNVECPHWENTWILMHYSFAPQKAFWITKFLGITSLHKLGNRREWHFWFNLMSYTFFLCYCALICKGEALKHGIGNYIKYISVNQYNTKFFFAYCFFFPNLLGKIVLSGD